MTKTFSFNTFNDACSKNISNSLKECNPKGLTPVFVCIGSDLVLGDSLGPLIGTFLRNKGVKTFVYGNLSYPITAKEVGLAGDYIKKNHPNTITVAIDAAVGNQEDVGLIRTSNSSIKPGLGVNKNLEKIGDISIIGVVSGKSLQNESLFNLTRLNLVYKMAEVIANGIENYLLSLESNAFLERKFSYGA